MKTIFIGKNCIEIEKTDSTNSYMARLQAVNPLFDGTVVLTGHQEQGRRQRGSAWQSEPRKNLTLSIFLQPTFLRLDEQFQLNKAVSLGVVDAIHPLLHLPQGGRKPPRSGSFPFGESWSGVAIKWPNDIYIADKKIAGILIENSVNGNRLQHSIIGIGININQEKFSPELPNPTSLKLVAGKEFDLKECLEQLCSSIEKRYLQLRNSSREIDSDYVKSLYRLGDFLNYNFKGESVKAKITGVSKTGKLVLEIENGKMLECDFKEVSFH